MPRPAAAAPAFTFGRSLQGSEQGQEAPVSISSRPEKANFDPPVETVRAGDRRCKVLQWKGKHS